MGYAVGILSVVLILLGAYIAYMTAQIRSMSRQLDKRMSEESRQPVSLELINHDLNKLAASINRCLKAEETLRLNGIREEKKFREMIADISHDLRTPLTAIKGYQQLLDTEELTQDQHRKLTIARKHTDELGQLIEHFFEYSYLVNSEPELHMERINLTKLVTDSLISFITTLEEHDLKVCFDEDTPTVFITADSEMITRILQNLIRNSIQHSAGDITVQLSAKNRALLSFTNPVNNSREVDLNRIFDRFYTGDRARSRSTGMGLAIVKLLTERMGGNVSASMEDGLLKISLEFNRDKTAGER